MGPFHYLEAATQAFNSIVAISCRLLTEMLEIMHIPPLATYILTTVHLSLRLAAPELHTDKQIITK